MPTWGEILTELNATALQEGGPPDFDGVRRKYLDELHVLTGRPTIIYYSNWLTDIQVPESSMTRADVQCFMEVIKELDGEDLDLILHLPGGELLAPGGIVDYLRTKFRGEIRAFVPVAAMSAGAMLALACDRIVMGAHSQLGPTDPQIRQRSGGLDRYVPVQAILQQFDMAREDFKENPSVLPVWVPILEQYSTSLLRECEALQELAQTLVSDWLARGMFKGDRTKSDRIAEWFSNFDVHLSHSRGIYRSQVREQGVVVDDLEASQELQDAVLSVHHATMHSFESLPVAKIIENHLGTAFVRPRRQ